MNRADDDRARIGVGRNSIAADRMVGVSSSVAESLSAFCVDVVDLHASTSGTAIGMAAA